MITKWPRRPSRLLKWLEIEVAGVYALFNHDALIYIGRSNCIGKRLISHKKKRRFTHFTFKAMPETKAYQTENIAISRFKPKFNRHVMLPASIEQIRKGGKTLKDFRYRQGHTCWA